MIVDTENHYVAQIKANQKTLLADVKQCVEQQVCLSEYILQEKGHGRLTKWTVRLYDASESPKAKIWKKLNSYIYVHRHIEKKAKTTIQHAYFMSDLNLDAQEFHQGIRGHWGIENKLHWVKDVVHKEDDNRLKSGNAPVNVSLFSTIALNIHRKNASNSVTDNQILFRANVKELFIYLRT